MRIKINLNRKEITDDILAKSNLLARQMARNPETEELAGDIMTPDDITVKPIVARSLTEAFSQVKKKCQQYLVFGRFTDDNRLEKIDETNSYEEKVNSSPATENGKHVLLTGIEHRITTQSESGIEIKVMDNEGNILARGANNAFVYTPLRMEEYLVFYSTEQTTVDVTYRWGDFGSYELELEMPKRFNIGMTESIKSAAHKLMVDYVMWQILKDQYAEKAKEYYEQYIADQETLRMALIARSTYSRAYAADWT